MTNALDEKGGETVSSIDTLREFIMTDLRWEGRKDQLTRDYPLIDNHVIDSLGLLTLVSFIENNFGVILDDAELLPENFNTLGAMSEMIEAKRAAVQASS